MGHILMHATVQLCIASIAYKYFFKHPGSAQMVCFMMLSNDQLRRMYQFLYNDCLMTFYLVLCLYFFSKKMIWLSAAVFSFSLGIKTGVLAVVPAFLGCV
jgi:Gpi18-like mannosyltransferase